MKQDNRLPASVRYSLARLGPLNSPGFWVSSAMLLLVGLVVWEMWTSPDGTTSTSPVSNPLDEVSAEGVDPTQELSAAARAIAEVDELEAYIRELNLNITVTPDKPQGRKLPRQQPSAARTLKKQPSSVPNLQLTDTPQAVGGKQLESVPPAPADISFYNPAISLGAAKGTGTEPVHPLKSAMERLSTSNSTWERTQVTPENLRPSAYGAIVPSQSSPSERLRPSAYGAIVPSQSSPSERLRPSAYGAIVPSQSASNQLRPGAYGAIVPSQSASNQLRPGAYGAIGPSQSASNQLRPGAYGAIAPTPLQPYNYQVPTAPGGPAVPPLIAPVPSSQFTRQIPQQRLPNSGVTNNLYNQPQQQPLTTPAPVYNSIQEQKNPRDGDIFDRFFNP